MFYHHPDHLGSGSYITDINGQVVQHIEYVPFGEVFIEERNGNFNTAYKFNAKELDEETGLYYYGARYYNPKTALWLSTDPLVEKTLQPYQYAYNNPIRFIDPTGMKPEDGIIIFNGNQIIISANIYLYGNGATNIIRDIYQKGINDRWGGTFHASSSDGANSFNVKFNIKVSLYENKEKNNPFIIPESWDPSNRDNFIKVSNDINRSYVSGGDEGVWRSQGRKGLSLENDNPAPHEVGHLLGLSDKYTDKNGAEKGWENNIMGNSQKGKVDQRNINGIIQDAMKAYENWIKDKNNIGKEFRYEINKSNLDKENN